MNKLFIILMLSVFFTTQASAQKDLTLEEAVSGQYQQFYPDHVFGFGWIENLNKYSYLKQYQTLVIGEVGGEEKEVLKISEVNEALDVKFNYFAGIKWKDENTIVLKLQNTVVTYNLKTKKGTKIELPENAERTTFDHQYNNIAYTIDNNLYYTSVAQYNQFAVTENEDKNIVSGQEIARSEMGITQGIFWSPTGNSLAFYQKDESKVHDYPLLDITQTPGKLNSIKYPMTGQPSEKAKLGIFSLKNNTTAFIAAKNGAENYLTNVSWTPDEQFILLAEVARSQKHIWVQKYKTDGTLAKTLFEEKKDTWVEPEKPAHFPSKNSNDFVWVSERDGFDNLYYYSIDGELKSQLTTNKFMLKDIVAAHHGEVFFTATGESPLNTLLYKVNTKGKQVLLTKEEGTHSVDVNCTGEYIFDQYSAHDIPNIAVIRKASGKEVKRMLEAENKLADYKLSEAEIKSIKSRDGVDLYTRMIKPKNFDASKKYPVLIYVYGGPHAQMITNSWYDGASLWMHWMANQGYVIFTLDNRGSGNRGVEFEHIIHRNLGVIEHQDQLDGVDYLSGFDFIDTSRIAVHGWSYGGYMTGTMMMKSPNIFKVGVAGGPVTDWKYYEAMYGERYMDTPEENKEGYEKTSLLNQAENLKGDLLLIHGTSDPVVVMQHNLSLVKKLVDLGIQVDFFPYPMHEHNVGGKDRIHLMRKVLDYIIDNNK
ncbi:S9 family peptidase [Brumimicrobium glaciale]|uniref:S9 family peptidase n=1 Tax=Brumimicrobium glaciale TaxID=200475 RepID=A0A4Q4KIG8_9FLAO|nr:DPP IV N-terminal domain-containing protein [Brumimicrobium glaciale]RYM33041.1 S9 family peptidase [Brumimicrobium glaciale]